MRSAIGLLAVLACAFAIVAAAVLSRDVSVMVPPPESVAEEFARQVATRRYDRALQYVDDTSGLTLIDVRLGGKRFHTRAGAVNRIEGEPGTIEGDRATASAVLETERDGRVRFSYRMRRISGLWKIVEWHVV